MSTLPQSPKDRVLAAVSALPSPTRSQVVTRQALLAVAALLVLAATALMHGLTVFAEKPLVYVLVAAGSVGVVALLATLVIGRFGSSATGPRRALIRRLNRAMVPALLIGSASANLAAPETLGWPTWSLSCHLACTIVLLMSGGLLALFAVIALRRADPSTPRATALTIGAVAGAWASLAVGLQCQYADPLHVLGTHVVPVVVLMLLTARFGSRFLGLDTAARVPSVDRA